ncbi:hypothetical protein ACFX1S_046347 [Malus domestica]
MQRITRIPEEPNSDAELQPAPLKTMDESGESLEDVAHACTSLIGSLVYTYVVEDLCPSVIPPLVLTEKRPPPLVTRRRPRAVQPMTVRRRKDEDMLCVELWETLSRDLLQALVYQQSKLKRLLHTTNNPKSYTDSPYSAVTEAESRGLRKDDANVQLVLFARKIDLLDDNEKLRAHMQGMQCRVMELEKLCKKMQSQMAKFSKSKAPPSHTQAVQPMIRFEST